MKQYVQVVGKGSVWYVYSGRSRFTCSNEQDARALAAALCKCTAECGRDDGRDDE